MNWSLFAKSLNRIDSSASFSKCNFLAPLKLKVSATVIDFLFLLRCPKVERVQRDDGKMVNIGEVCHEVTYHVDQYEYCCQSPGSGFDLCTHRDGRTTQSGQFSNWTEWQQEQRQRERQRERQDFV